MFTPENVICVGIYQYLYTEESLSVTKEKIYRYQLQPLAKF